MMTFCADLRFARAARAVPATSVGAVCTLALDRSDQAFGNASAVRAAGGDLPDGLRARSAVQPHLQK